MADRRKNRDTLKYKIEILTQEINLLTSRKRKLDDKAETELAELIKQYAEVQNQLDIRSFNQDNATLNSVTMQIIKASFEKKAWIQTYLKKDLPEQWRPYWIDYNKKMEMEVIQIIFRSIQNPVLLLSVIKELHKLKEYDLSIEVIQFCYTVLSDVRKARDAYTLQHKEHTDLQQEESQLHKMLKYLPIPKREQLREYILVEKLRYDLPIYLDKSFNPDTFALELSETALMIVLQSPQNPDPSVPTMENLVPETVDEMEIESIEEMIDEESIPEKNDSMTEEESEEKNPKEKSRKKN